MDDGRKSPLERAFELATSGKCLTVAELRYQLQKEGFSVVQLTGRSLTKQLTAMIREAQRAHRT